MNVLRLAVVASLLCAVAAQAQGSSRNRFAAQLRGFDEVPSLSIQGTGTLTGRVSGSTFRYTLTYPAVGSPVTQAHFHLGQQATNGGVVVFICSNGSGPAGTPPCPENGGTIEGTVSADDVVGAPAQALGPGEMDEFIAALRAGMIYVNVHSTDFPGGVIRGQLRALPRRP